MIAACAVLLRAGLRLLARARGAHDDRRRGQPAHRGHPERHGPRRLVDSRPRHRSTPPSATAACRRVRRPATASEILYFPSNRGLAKSGGDATVQVEGDAMVRIVSACYTCAVGDATEGIVRWTSTDGGTTFAAEPSLGGTPTNAGMGPDGITLAGGVYVTPADGDKIIARPGAADTTAVDAAAGDSFVHSPSIVQVPGQAKLVYATSDLFGIRTAVYRGGDLGVGGLMNPDLWAVDQVLPTPSRASATRA